MRLCRCLDGIPGKQWHTKSLHPEATRPGKVEVDAIGWIGPREDRRAIHVTRGVEIIEVPDADAQKYLKGKST
jgi:hypothetical protein